MQNVRGGFTINEEKLVTMIDEIIDSLEKNGWTIAKNYVWHLGNWGIPHPVRTNSIYLFEKTYLQAGNVNVVISIHPYEESFVVIDSAEHRLSGPNITVEGVVKTVNDALVLARGSCQYWDERLGNMPKEESSQL